VAELPEREVASRSLLYAHVRRAGYQLQDSSIRKAADDLVVAGRFVEVYGKRGAADLDGRLVAGRWIFHRRTVTEYADAKEHTDG